MSVIQSLKSEGVLKGYWDFRSGTFSDLSGNDHDATPTDTYLNREGAKFDNPAAAGTNLLNIANHADFNFGTSTDFSIYTWIKTNVDISARNMRTFSNSNITGGFFSDLQNGIPRLFFEAGANYNLVYDAAVDPTISAHLCWVIDRDVSGYAYYNGSLVASTETNPGDRQENLDTANPLQIGKVLTQTANMFDGIYHAILIVNRVLTGTEVAQIQGELEGMKWPSKSFGKIKSERNIDISDSNLLAAWEMIPNAGSIVDLSANKNNCTIIGAIHALTPLGDSLYFDGVDDYLSTTYTVDNDNAFTTSVWLRTTDNDALNYVYGYYDAPRYWTLYTNAAGNVSCRIGQGSGGNLLTATSTGSINDSAWHNLITVFDGVDTVTIYIDGVADGTVTGAVDSFFSALAPGIAAVNHSVTGIGSYLECNLVNLEIYSEEKDINWITKKYEEGAKKISYKTDWGALESNDAVSSTGTIRNTDMEILSGQWRLNDNGNKKVVYCNSTGYVSIPVKGSTTEAAYGTWEFSWTKNDGNTGAYFGFICNENDSVVGATQNGYALLIDNGERLRLRRITNGAVTELFYTDTSYIILGTEYRFRVTRNTNGEFTVYRKGGTDTEWTLIPATVGTNPVVNTTHTVGGYIVWGGVTTDEVVYSDINGDNSIVKRVGVYNV